MKFVVAADPGKMTGYAIWGRHAADSDNYVSSAQYDFQEGLSRIEDFLASGVTARVVAERYVISRGTLEKTRQSWSLEVIGALRYLALKYTGEDIKLQSAADAKNFAPDTRLKKLGWHKPGMVHANDASRHLLLYLCSTRIWIPELLIDSGPGMLSTTTD